MLKTLILITIIAVSNLHSQSLYIDPGQVAILTLNGQILKDKQEEQVDKLSRLNQLQVSTGIALNKINTVQEKVYDGMREVSSIITGSMSLQRTYQNLDDAVRITAESVELISDNPHYSILMGDIMQRFQESSVEMYTDIASIITSNAQNLMTAGDRKQLLYEIENNSYQLKISALMIKIRMRRIERVGFLKAALPFSSGYRNRDLETFKQAFDL
jgi:hypothetical protein